MPTAVWHSLSIGRLGWPADVVAREVVAAIVIPTAVYRGV
jgi:hypothetical protein